MFPSPADERKTTTMKLHSINPARLGRSEPPTEPDDDNDGRECAVDLRYSRIWEDAAELEAVLDEAGIPFSIASVHALCELNRLLLLQPCTKDDEIAQVVRGLVADIDRVVAAAAEHYVDTFSDGEP
jgi:hypothetical protein